MEGQRMICRNYTICRICGILIANLLITISGHAMIALGPVPNCDLAVLDGSYYIASTSHGPVNMLYVEILQVGKPDDSIHKGDKLWLYVRDVGQSSSPISIGHLLHGDLDGYCDDLGTGESQWGFVGNHFTIIGGTDGLKPLEKNPPSYQNIVRFLCILPWIVMTGWIFQRYRRRAIVKEVGMFARQLSLMSDGGIRISDCLAILLDQSRSPVFRKILVKLRSDIDSGLSFSAAVEKHRPLFSDILVCLIKDGEASGQLAQNMGVFADFLEGSEPLHIRATTVMIYPGVVLMITWMVVLGFLVFVIPQFKDAFFSLEISTGMKLLFGLSDIFASWWYLVLTIMAGGGFLAVSVLDYSVGMLIRASTIGMLTHNLSILAALGVPLLRGLELSTQTTVGDLPAGKGISDSPRTDPETISNSDMVPVDDPRQIASKLLQITRFCGSEVERALARWNMIVEVGTILLMALVIGGIVLTVFKPTGGILFGKWW
jgi:type IV pilus assembly protein PilC